MRELLVSGCVRDWFVHGGCAEEIGASGAVDAVGLLVGAYCGGGVTRVLHVSLTRDEDGGGVVPLDSASGSLVGHHAKQLLRMLPGGLNIVGVVVVAGGGKDVFKEGDEKVDRVVVQGGLLKQLAKLGAKWYGTEPDKDRVLLHFNPTGGKFQARGVGVGLKQQEQVAVVFDGSSSGGGGGCGLVKVETKFECQAWVSGRDSSEAAKKGFGGDGLKKDFFRVISQWEDTLSSSVVLVDGKVPSEEDVVGEESPPRVSILVDRIPRVEQLQQQQLQEDFVSHVNVHGVVHSVSYVESGASTNDVKRCVILDILRSLVSRLEMHCESLIDESGDGCPGGGGGGGDGGPCSSSLPSSHPSSLLLQSGSSSSGLSGGKGSSGKVYHELPRRVFVGLVGGVDVCDYLFPGEGAKDSVNSFREVLGVLRHEQDIDESKETPFDLEDLDHLKGSMEELLSRAESISKIPSDIVGGVLFGSSSGVGGSSSRKAVVVAVGLVAVVVLILAVAIPFFKNNKLF